VLRRPNLHLPVRGLTPRGGTSQERLPLSPVAVRWVFSGAPLLRLAFLDTETTGLDPETHEVLEIAILKIHPDGDHLWFHTRIKPQDLESADPIALAREGYADNPSLWDTAPTLQEVAEDLERFLRDTTLVGHNVGFDVGMLQGVFKRSGLPPLRISHRNIDTMTLVLEHLFPLGLGSASMDNTRKFLGWSLEGAHTAVQDAQDAMRLYYLLNRAGPLTLLKIRLGRWFRILRGRLGT
jgi:DNA polymerase III epsilon subunit-like protein